MKRIHTIFITAVLFLYASAAFSQSKFPIDAKGFVAYKQSYKLNPKIKADDVYAIAQKWFTDKAPIFTQKNAEVPFDPEKALKNKNKIEVDKNFENSQPLKSLDPAGRRITGRSVLQYYNGNNKSIRLLYLDYDVYILVENNTLTITLGNYRYFHFSPNTYGKVNLFSFKGGPACEAMGHLEELIKCQNSNDEFSILATYCDNEATKIMTSLKTTLSTKKVLLISSAPATASKTITKKAAPVAAKPTATPVKK